MMDDELLSAYVDGELSQAELAAVEARLRDDPQSRKLVEELRAVSATLRALPRHKLGVDLREAVLDQELVHPHSLLDDEDEGSDRRWVWAVMAIAAAFFLAVYMPNNEREKQQVAQVDAKDRRAVQAAPHLVGPAERPREPMELVAEGVLAPTVSDDISKGGGSFAVEGDQAIVNQGLASRRQVAALDAPTSVAGEVTSAEAYEVHLSPGSSNSNPSDFDELLAKHGISVRNVPGSGGRLDEARDVSETGPELVLVEAPLEDIQRIVAACGDERSAWRAPRVVGREDSADKLSPLPDASAKEESASAAAQPNTSRGWARHLGRSIAAPKAVPINGQVDGSASPKVRVLFILHPAAE